MKNWKGGGGREKERERKKDVTRSGTARVTKCDASCVENEENNSTPRKWFSFPVDDQSVAWVTCRLRKWR